MSIAISAAWQLGSSFEILFAVILQASSGPKPARMNSTVRNEGQNLIILSPSPLAAAAPTCPSAYKPDPTIGESPTRPG
eukprot:CAMPEP_0198731352 /NCGR_PEP_ID=MMETSP1475-20131203/29282_1 /TAXON_ID= ORGANISM="Unidentified sp., Strain CCMP1999" /NCGR_SAMPLE_ID=MMETSP1475 /ASSEMBLY_ACC=CAM_ASM_001111 /LENGTH=78 /DNA_ID=CAMNT_0044494309 /DNA_START=731 /DNA_END=963 /DNA_ORIENTATION=-